MASAIPSAELRLSYPLYAVDFDPQDANRLIIGGGGGAARSGVGNKVSVLDVSREDSIQVISELELSRDEDSVNTLAVDPRRKDKILFYSGINSAEDDLKKGKNEHFRVFSADLPSRAKEPKIAELSRSALFSTADAEAYQRLLRISGPVGAVATGTIGRSKEAQIAIFDLPAANSSKPAPKLRGKLELEKEAMDMDMLQISDDEHQLVYCDDYNIYILSVGATSSSASSHCVFTMPHDQSTGATARPAFRCIRYLTPTFLLAVANLPKAGGAVLQGFRLPKPADLGKESSESHARLAISAKLPKSVARATGMAVRNLFPPSTPYAKQEDTQFAIAVTGQDSSVSLYTLEHQTVANVNLITKLHPITTLKEVHLGPISGLAFSSPVPSATANKPPHLKLASIGSMGNTVLVHSLPLREVPPSTPTPEKEKEKKTPTRYVLALKSAAPTGMSLLLGFALFAAFLAVFLQGVLEVRGLTKPVVGARRIVPEGWCAPFVYKGYQEGKGVGMPEVDVGVGVGGEEAKVDAEPEVMPLMGEGVGGEGHGKGKDAEGSGFLGGLADQGKVVLSAEEEEDGVKVEGHDEERHGEAREWEALDRGQKEAWKQKLKKAGHWGEEMGEAVFKGVFFGELAGVVGAMVR